MAPLDLVTTSALLDLVSAEWLERLAVEAAARRLPVYAALTYQGRATLEPAEPFDLEIVAAVNRHQRRDKGFGPALGPEAAAARGARLRARRLHGRAAARPTGCSGRKIARSSWRCSPAGRAPPASSATCRTAAIGVVARAPARARVAAGRSSMRVGHVDFFATPTRSAER